MQSAKVTGDVLAFYKQCADMESAFATDNQMCSCPIECVQCHAIYNIIPVIILRCGIEFVIIQCYGIEFVRCQHGISCLYSCTILSALEFHSSRLRSSCVHAMLTHGLYNC